MTVASENLNTSHVKVKLYYLNQQKLNLIDLNTSHVKVKLVSGLFAGVFALYLNTSHVKVKLSSVKSNTSVSAFKYISC